ncbi:MAG TPA: DUF6765 family protein [Fluviicoccus sp.]|nr:DUF6765 family protein [Fluviicoccus sp.]
MTRNPSARLSMVLLVLLPGLSPQFPALAAEPFPTGTSTQNTSPVTSGPWNTGNPPATGGMCLSQNLGDPGSGVCETPPAALPSDQPSSAVGNPLDVMSGNKFQSETDLPALSGPLGLSFSRTYNSRSQSRGLLGHGWRHAYELTLLETRDKLQIIQPDGRRLIFARTADGGCVSARPGDGTVEASASGWIWRWPSGRELRFEPASPDRRYGRLTEIRDNRLPGQPALTLRYSVNGSLLSIRDRQGRSLLFRHGVYGANRWPEIQVEGPTGVFRYRLDGDGNLLTVQRPDGVQLGYYYEPFRQGGDIHNLTGKALWRSASRQWQRVATWAYDPQDRAVLSEHAGGVERVILRFDSTPVALGTDGLPVFQTVLTDSLGRETRYRWQVAGQDWRLLESRGAGCASCGAVNRRYAYNTLGQVRREETLSRDGAVLNWTESDYDIRGRLTARRQGGAGIATEFQRLAYERPDLPWAVTAVTRPSVMPGRQAAIRYDYDRQGRLLAQRESGYSPLGEALVRERRYTRDAAGRVLSEDGPLPNLPDGRGDITRYFYDTQGRLERIEGVGGLQLAVTGRDAVDRVTGLALRNGSRRETWRLEYDIRGHLRQLDREGEGLPVRRQLFRYDDEGRMLARTDAAGLESRFTYDAAGRLQNLVQPDGRLVRFDRDSENRLLSAQWRGGQSPDPFRRLDWQYTRTGSADQTRLTDSLGLISEQQQSDDGRTVQARDALGRERTTLYDGLGRWQASRLRAFGINLPVAWRQREQGLAVQGEAGLQAAAGYDDWGRKVLERLPGQGLRLYRYDSTDNRIAEAGEDGGVRRYRYDYAGHRIAEGTAAQPSLITTRFDGDLPVLRTDGVESRRWRYNSLGEPVAESRNLPGPDGRSREWHQAWSYDPAGRVRLETRGNLNLAYVYSVDGRVSAIHASEGRLASLLGGWLSGPVPLLSRPVADQVRYDAWGQINHLRLMHGGEQYFQRDRRGRLTGILNRHETSATPGWFALARTLLPEGWARTVEGVMGWRTIHLSHDAYAYDPLDRLARRREGGVSERYDYDAAGRLARVETLSGGRWQPAVTYEYDAQGNRRRERTPVLQTDYRFAGDGLRMLGRQWRQLPRDKDAEPPAFLAQLASYDAGGRPWLWWQGMTRPDGGLSLTGLQSDRSPLWRLKLAGSQPAAWLDETGKVPLRYGYDLSGMPAWEQLQTGPNRFWRRGSDYAGALRVHEVDAWRAEQGREQQVERDYVYLGGRPVALRVSDHAGTAWGEVWANRLGAPVAVRDDSGRERWSAAYEPFGGRKARAGQLGGVSWAVSLRLPGQYEDPVTGFYQNGFRTYLPEAGRYLTPDPAGLRGGLNPFVYVGSDPLNAVDPWGLYQIDMHYYMTYFLGIVTGFSADQARTIALATQFVDENDYTVPLRDGGLPVISTIVDGYHNAIDDRLAFYHFVNTKEGWINTTESGSYDPVQLSGESDKAYRIRRLTANLESIPQIQNLEFNYQSVSGCNQKLQFFGEFLHAFEDTFAHRDKNNDPFGLNGGTGHATGGENPDYTYNHVVGGTSVLGRGTWDVNEDRTLIAEEQVYRKMVDFRDSVGASGKVVPWEELRDYLVVFNSIHENAHGADGAEDLHTIQYKIRYLQSLLNGKGGNEYEMVFPEGSQSGREVVMLDLSEKLEYLDAERFDVILNVDGTVSAVGVKMPEWGYKAFKDNISGSEFSLIKDDLRAGADGFDVIEGLKNRVDILRKLNPEGFNGVVWDTGHKTLTNYRMYLDGGGFVVKGVRPR